MHVGTATVRNHWDEGTPAVAIEGRRRGIGGWMAEKRRHGPDDDVRRQRERRDMQQGRIALGEPLPQRARSTDFEGRVRVFRTNRAARVRRVLRGGDSGAGRRGPPRADRHGHRAGHGRRGMVAGWLGRADTVASTGGRRVSRATHFRLVQPCAGDREDQSCTCAARGRAFKPSLMRAGAESGVNYRISNLRLRAQR